MLSRSHCEPKSSFAWRLRVCGCCISVICNQSTMNEEEKNTARFTSFLSFIVLPLASTIFPSMCKHHPNDILSSSIIFLWQRYTFLAAPNFRLCKRNRKTQIKMLRDKFSFVVVMSQLHVCSRLVYLFFSRPLLLREKLVFSSAEIIWVRYVICKAISTQ